MDRTTTRILQPWNDFSKVDPETLDMASERGTMVHTLCTSYADGRPIIPRPDLKGYMMSFKRWFDHFVDTVIFTELRIEHPSYDYSGQPDLLVVLIDGTLALVDLKTPANYNKLWRLQIASYMDLANQWLFIEGPEKYRLRDVDKGFSLQLRANGGEARVAAVPDFKAALNAFLSAYVVDKYLT